MPRPQRTRGSWASGHRHEVARPLVAVGWIELVDRGGPAAAIRGAKPGGRRYGCARRCMGGWFPLGPRRGDDRPLEWFGVASHARPSVSPWRRSAGHRRDRTAAGLGGRHRRYSRVGTPLERHPLASSSSTIRSGPLTLPFLDLGDFATRRLGGRDDPRAWERSGPRDHEPGGAAFGTARPGRRCVSRTRARSLNRLPPWPRVPPTTRGQLARPPTRTLPPIRGSSIAGTASGGAASPHPFIGSGQNRLTGVSAPAADAAWIVGGDGGGTGLPFALVWNGATWASDTLPALPGDMGDMSGVAVLPSGDGWAIGGFWSSSSTGGPNGPSGSQPSC